MLFRHSSLPYVGLSKEPPNLDHLLYFNCIFPSRFHWERGRKTETSMWEFVTQNTKISHDLPWWEWSTGWQTLASKQTLWYTVDADAAYSSTGVATCDRTLLGTSRAPRWVLGVMRRGLVWRDSLFFATQRAICSLRPFNTESSLKHEQYTVKPTSSLKEKYLDPKLHLKMENKGKNKKKFLKELSQQGFASTEI